MKEATTKSCGGAGCDGRGRVDGEEMGRMERTAVVEDDGIPTAQDDNPLSPFILALFLCQSGRATTGGWRRRRRGGSVWAKVLADLTGLAEEGNIDGVACVKR